MFAKLVRIFLISAILAVLVPLATKVQPAKAEETGSYVYCPDDSGQPCRIFTGEQRESHRHLTESTYETLSFGGNTYDLHVFAMRPEDNVAGWLPFNSAYAPSEIGFPADNFVALLEPAFQWQKWGEYTFTNTQGERETRQMGYSSWDELEITDQLFTFYGFTGSEIYLFRGVVIHHYGEGTAHLYLTDVVYIGLHKIADWGDTTYSSIPDMVADWPFAEPEFPEVQEACKVSYSLPDTGSFNGYPVDWTSYNQLLFNIQDNVEITWEDCPGGFDFVYYKDGVEVWSDGERDETYSYNTEEIFPKMWDKMILLWGYNSAIFLPEQPVNQNVVTFTTYPVEEVEICDIVYEDLDAMQRDDASKAENPTNGFTNDVRINTTLSLWSDKCPAGKAEIEFYSPQGGVQERIYTEYDGYFSVNAERPWGRASLVKVLLNNNAGYVFRINELPHPFDWDKFWMWTWRIVVFLVASALAVKLIHSVNNLVQEIHEGSVRSSKRQSEIATQIDSLKATLVAVSNQLKGKESKITVRLHNQDGTINEFPWYTRLPNSNATEVLRELATSLGHNWDNVRQRTKAVSINGVDTQMQTCYKTLHAGDTVDIYWHDN